MTENDLTGLLLKLADLGVTGIKIFYSGGGDSGALDDIVYTTMELSKDEDDAFIEINDLQNYGEHVLYLKHLDSALAADIENFAEEKILNDIEDWWNNDGGYGVMLVQIPSGKYKIYNEIYITNSESYEHEGNLIDKSLN
jgi:hypothetical protein